MKITYQNSWVFWVMCFVLTLVQAQDSTNVDVLEFSETNRVQWIDQIPPLKEDIKNPNKGWLKRLLLGDREITSFQKPIHVIGSGHDTAIVLDQGSGYLFYVEDQKLTIPKVLKKQKHPFPSLVAAWLLPSKELLFSDSKRNTIFVLAEDKKSLRELNEKLDLQQPTGIAYSILNDEIWIVETGAHRISVLDSKGSLVKTIGKRGSGQGEFNYPTSIWIDGDGKAYVVDALNYRIQIFDADGTFISMFGENGNGTGYLARPKGVATDSRGHIYVVDALFHGVQIFDAKGRYLYQFGKQGSRTEEFWMPSGIFIDAEDHIFVADSYNARIQIFELIYKE